MRISGDASRPENKKEKDRNSKKRTTNPAQGPRESTPAANGRGRRRQAKLREGNEEREQEGRLEEDDEEKGKQPEDGEAIPKRAKRKKTNTRVAKGTKKRPGGSKSHP